jgi:hypothetical protein
MTTVSELGPISVTGGTENVVARLDRFIPAMAVLT